MRERLELLCEDECRELVELIETADATAIDIAPELRELFELSEVWEMRGPCPLVAAKF